MGLYFSLLIGCTDNFASLIEEENKAISNESFSNTIVTTISTSTLAENGIGYPMTATIQVKLLNQPTAQSTVTISSNNESAISINGQTNASINFTPENFSIEQEVTIAALQDQDFYDANVTITLNEASSAVKKVENIQIFDDDLFLSPANQGEIQLNWAEIDPNGTYTIVRKLGTVPSSSSDGTLIYQGSGELITDTTVPKWQTVHYKVYSYNSGGDLLGTGELDYIWMPIPDTGQTTCYNSSSNISCPSTGQDFFGQDANFVNTPYARSFTGPTQHGTFTNDYVTKDNTTGLTWTSCSIGQSWDQAESNCSGVSNTEPYGATQFEHSMAIGACTSLNSMNSGTGYYGITQWRLPSIEEANTLANYENTNPAVESNYFPNTVFSFPSWYWTSSVSVGNNEKAWRVAFSDGYVSTRGKNETYYVRCVSNNS